MDESEDLLNEEKDNIFNFDQFDYDHLKDLDEYLIEEIYNDVTFDGISEYLFFVKEYTKENRLSIAEYITFSDMFDFLDF